MTEPTRATDHRLRVVETAARLLREQGPGAVTTRGVAEAAGVQAPTIYRLFGDKDGLLDAVAEHVMATYVESKAAVVMAAELAGVDPVEDLVAGWRAQVEFGLANPDLFRLLSDPRRVAGSAAASAGREVLEARVRRVAAAGRLRVEEARAVAMIQAGGIGVITTLLTTPPPARDPRLADDVLHAVLAQILVGATDPTRSADEAVAAAITLRAHASDLERLTSSERALLGEWLERVAAR